MKKREREATVWGPLCREEVRAGGDFKTDQPPLASLAPSPF